MKVRACNSETYSDWSAVRAFTTVSPAVQVLPPSPQEKTPPAPVVPQPSPETGIISGIPYWALWLMGISGGLLVVMLVMLVTLIMLTVRLGRL